MPESMRVNLNGRLVEFRAAPNRTLVDFLREDLGLKGCKIGCDQSVCGACTVILNGEPTPACSTFAFEADGGCLQTIEGQLSGDVLSPVQQAFLECSSFQCGYCTPGMIMLATALLQKNPTPDEDAIRSWMGSSICRCTGYGAILSGVRRAIELWNVREREA